MVRVIKLATAYILENIWEWGKNNENIHRFGEIK